MRRIDLCEGGQKFLAPTKGYAHLARHTTFEQDRRSDIDELQVLQDGDTLLIVWEKLEVLIRNGQS